MGVHSSAVERFPDKKEVHGPTPCAPTTQLNSKPRSVRGHSLIHFFFFLSDIAEGTIASVGVFSVLLGVVVPSLGGSEQVDNIISPAALSDLKLPHASQ